MLKLFEQERNKTPFLDLFKTASLAVCKSKQCNGKERVHETEISIELPAECEYLVVVIPKKDGLQQASEITGFRTKNMRLPTTEKATFNLRSALVSSTKYQKGETTVYLALDPKWKRIDVRYGAPPVEQERFVSNLKNVSLLFLKRNVTTTLTRGRADRAKEAIISGKLKYRGTQSF